jgi:hypothetical protein
MEARQLTVELDGARDLYLVVTYGGDSYDSDQAIWAEPTLHGCHGETLDLSTRKPDHAQVGWGKLIVNKDHQDRPLGIAGRRFSRGFWAHGPSLLHFQLGASYERFTAWVGLTEGATRGSVEFQVRSDPPRMPDRAEYTKRYPSASASRPKLPPLPPAQESSHTFNVEAAQPLVAHGIDQLVFVRRYTLNANHVYTEYVNSSWMPGGGLCVLDLKTGELRELAAEFTKNGVVNRFDVSFDAQRIAFDFKAAHEEGYRIYEINVDGTGLRPLTTPPKHEAELVARYKRGYHHGTDDLHPCYLPDGGLAFVSTRCQYGVLCDGGDNFTVKNLYRIDADGGNMRPLSNSALSEATPVMLPDGRILYHRWEYVDKTAGNIKGLWAVNPDGSNSVEIYGNDVAFPETMIYARPIPDTFGKIVMLGASHCCPNNAMGAVIKIDRKDDIRSPDTMQFITPDIHALHHNGFHFRDGDGQWVHDKTGKLGRLFKDPYPIQEDLYLVSHKPQGLDWADPKGYELCLLDGEGNTTQLFKDENVSVWHPFPLVPREVPPVVKMARDEGLAERGLAKCVVTDIYAGLQGVPSGTVKYIRVLEELGRPWAARKSWNDRHGQTHAHSVIGNGILGVKVQHGVVPVEEDGSAHFFVPAMRNIYFQVLDENFMALQTERTYVNYMAGETRSCVGCHETPKESPAPGPRIPLALLREPSTPGPQPGESAAGRVFDYDRQIQPIWDRHCVSCHNDQRAEGGLNLAGNPVQTFSESYNQLIALGRTSKQVLGCRSLRNEDAASLGQEAMQYLPPYTLCSPTSTLAGLLSQGQIRMRDRELQSYVDSLRQSHKEIQLTEAEFIQVVNWIDVNCPYHPSYWGRFNTEHIDHPNFRPPITIAEAQMREVPESVRRAETLVE